MRTWQVNRAAQRSFVRSLCVFVSISLSPFAPAWGTPAQISGDTRGGQEQQAGEQPQRDRGPQLTITKSHSGSLTQGQRGAYVVTVSNTSDRGRIGGAVTVTETVPSGLTLVSMAGEGWDCTANQCTRTDPLSEGSSYPRIVVTVDVAGDASSPQVNSATVSWRGRRSATATDPTTIVPPSTETWISHGPEGGDVLAVAIDPLTPTTLYAGTGTGVFKSPDGGESWSAASAGLPANTNVKILAIDPVTPSTVYAAGAFGVFKSADGGGSWGAVNNGLPASITALVINPVTPTTLYAASLAGVFKSVDGGGSWSAVNVGLPPGPGGSIPISALAIDPVTPTTLYAGFGTGDTPSDTIFKSVNGGASWSGVFKSRFGVSMLAIDPLTPRVYAVIRGDCVCWSEDGGATWRSSLGFFPGSFIAIDPLTPTTLYAATTRRNPTTGQSALKSVDGGASWSPFGPVVPVAGAFVIDPLTPTTLYATTTEGLLKSTDAGENWSAVNLVLTNTFVSALAIDPVTPATLYAGTDRAVFKSEDGGGSWNRRLGFGPVTAIAIDPVTPTTLYAGTTSGEGVFKSADGGGSWSAITSELPELRQVLALAIDPLTPTTLYAGTLINGVFKSEDGGASWNPSSSGLPTSVSVTALAVNPLTPAALYAVADGALFTSADGGGNWSAVTIDLPTNTIIATLAIDPLTPTTLYAGTKGTAGATGAGVFKSMNGGGSWNAINNGLPTTDVSALAIAPLTPTTLYAGTNGVGVFTSVDAGANWSAINDGLTNPFVSTLAIDPLTPTTLYAGTNGGGVFVRR